MIGLSIPKLIFETPSEFNDVIRVYRVGKILKLIVDNLTQSANWDSEYSKRGVWGKITDLIYKLHPKAKNVLILGLGGGTVPHLLSQKMPDVDITTVEIDPKMVEVAQKFFELDSVSNHNVIVADALRVLTHPEKYDFRGGYFDVILVDIYCGQKYPDLGTTGSFFSGIKHLLSSSGHVVFNRVNLRSQQHEVDRFVESVRNNFKGVNYESIAGRTNSDNLLIYGRI